MSVSKFITTTEAAHKMGISRSTLHRKLRRGGDVPPFVRIDQRTVRWFAAEVDAWVLARTHRGEQAMLSSQQGVRSATPLEVHRKDQTVNTGGGAALAGVSDLSRLAASVGA